MNRSESTDRGSRYRDDGFVVERNLLDKAEVEATIAEATAVCRGERGAIDGLAMLDQGASDAEFMRRHLAIHFPHKISKHFVELLSQPAIVDVLRDVIGPNVKCMQSMLFIKAAQKPGQAWHQDENFIPTRDRSLCGVWIALDDATVDNGCLWVLPGSHAHGVIWPSKPHGTRDFDEGRESFGFPESADRAVPVEVEAGGVVFFNGYLLHRSLPNRSPDRFRRALVNHYMSAESLLPWDWDGRLAATRDNRDIVLVAGSDPYAYKGTENLTFPYVRREVPDPDSDLFR
jgi:phytanoyl-CoA hydroxylase